MANAMLDASQEDEAYRRIGVIAGQRRSHGDMAHRRGPVEAANTTVVVPLHRVQPKKDLRRLIHRGVFIKSRGVGRAVICFTSPGGVRELWLARRTLRLLNCSLRKLSGES